MAIKELYLYNFRNYETLKINVDYPEVYFVGKNGQGKTNILEALYYLCYASSFRTKNDAIIVRHGETQMAASARFHDKDGQLNKISVQSVNNTKKIILNDKNINDRRDIMSNMPCIVFCHGDLDFVIGSPDKKRLFFDQTLSLIQQEYVEYLRKYKKILNNKNKLLKSSQNIELISVYNRQLVETGLVIQRSREIIIEKFNIILMDLFGKISDLKGKINIEYVKSWKTDEPKELETYLNEKINYEIKMKTSCYGPHRDNFRYKYNDSSFNDMASTGQLRLLSLILRASQGIFFQKKSKRKPILLLDDVLLELDPEKRSKFMDLLPEYEQAFFTFLPDSTILERKSAIVMTVENGRVTI